MANINKELNQIKNAVYGKDVRQAIHDGIEKAYNDATSGGAGDTNLEVVLARGNYDSLNKRLDASDSQLAQTESMINNLDDKKADENAVSNSLNVLKNQKVDQVTFNIATQKIEFYANESLIDSIDITEASNASLVQDYIDTLVSDGLIEGIALADGSVNNDKLADKSVSRNKLDND